MPGLNERARETQTVARILPGGFSGALVMIVWIAGLVPIVMKAGPSREITREREKRTGYQGTDAELAELGVDKVLGPIDVEVDGRPVDWSVLCYRYIGGLTYRELDEYGDFASYLRRFVLAEDPADSPGGEAVRTCLREAALALTKGKQVAREVHGRPLSFYLPAVRWERNIASSLTVAHSLWPDMADLRDFPQWFTDAAEAIAVAPVADRRLLHGDARLANVLVESAHSRVHLIDFGNAREGHIFDDLARFELDVLLSTAPRHDGGDELVQDDLVETFLHALGDDFSLSSLRVEARHARCLKMWREQLADVLSNMSMHGAAMMYRWFLLVECLRRLRWVGNNGPKAAGVDVPSLLRLICALRRRLSGENQYGIVPIATPSDALRVLHCEAAFVPSHGRERAVNSKRNLAKRHALEQAARQSTTVRVLAETGFSYLSPRGALHDSVLSVLNNGGSLKVVICNPAFIESYGVSASYLNKSPSSEWTDDARLLDNLRAKFDDSLNGVMLLKERYKHLVNVRYARFGIGFTALISRDTCFFEPYFRSVRRRRDQVLFDTFELQFRLTADSHIRTLLQETFDFHWKHSDPAEDLKALEKKWQTVRRHVFQVWRGSLDGSATVPSR